MSCFNSIFFVISCSVFLLDPFLLCSWFFLNNCCLLTGPIIFIKEVLSGLVEVPAGFPWQLYRNVFLPCFSWRAQQAGRLMAGTFENKKQAGKLMTAQTAQVRKTIFWTMSCVGVLPFCAEFGVGGKRWRKRILQSPSINYPVCSFSLWLQTWILCGSVGKNSSHLYIISLWNLISVVVFIGSIQPCLFTIFQKFKTISVYRW